jgi:hypothetical protein
MQFPAQTSLFVQQRLQARLILDALRFLDLAGELPQPLLAVTALQLPQGLGQLPWSAGVWFF